MVAGSLLTLLPDAVVSASWPCSSWSARSSCGAASAAAPRRRTTSPTRPPHPSFLKTAAISFGVLFAAEWGDLSQLATAGLAARYNDPLSVFIGAWAALLVVSALAVFLGKKLADKLPIRLIRLVAAILFSVFAVIAVIETIRLLTA